MKKSVLLPLALAVTLSIAAPVSALISKGPGKEPEPTPKPVLTEVETWDVPSSARFEIKTERPYYDANIDRISTVITNRTAVEAGYGMHWQLQFNENGTWKAVPIHQNLFFPDIAAILPPNSSNSEGYMLTHAYALPLKAGGYRIVISVSGDRIAAPFQILSPESCLQIDEPESIRFTLSTPEHSGTFLVSPQEYPEYVTAFWHELIAFPKASEPLGPYGEPAANIRLFYKNNAYKDVALYSTDDGVYARLDGAWYKSGASDILTRLVKKGEEAGSGKPQSGEALVQALNQLEPLKKVKFAAHQFSTPFAFPGWQSNRTSSGVTISIFQFPSAQRLNHQMHYLYDNGYTIGVESVLDGMASFETKNFSAWTEPPHYFKAGSRLVLYNGSDDAILSALTALLGEEVRANT